MEWLTQASTIHLTAFILSAVTVTVDVVRRFIRNCIKRKGHPLPPGPTALPFLGSAISVNTQEPWLTYTAWRAKYGDVMYVRLLDTDLIVLNSCSVATELLEKRSQIYSDRPFIATLHPYGHFGNTAFARYGPYWRLTRRIVHQTFRAEAAIAFRPMQLRRARELITNIIDDPDGYPLHYGTFAAAVSMSVVYDYDLQPREDPLVKIVDDFGKASFPALTPEKAVLLKAFPFLFSVPEWVPVLSRIRREASKAYALGTKMIETPYQLVWKRMEAKEEISADTMVFDHIRRMEKMDEPQRAEYETALKHTSSSIFLDQFDLDDLHSCDVIGTDRLPEYGDRPFLPYVEAIVRESLRWHPVAPIGIPHAVQPMTFTKGATIIANVCPERFLDREGRISNENDPASFIFGFGRRICPGRYMADGSVWIGIATMLATLDFNAIKDASGNDIEFEAEFAAGLAHRLAPFPCNLTTRAHITRVAPQLSLEK